MRKKATAVFRTATTEVVVGAAPRVVGTLSALPPRGDFAGDIVEVRLDKMARISGWLKHCAALQAAGRPVLLTVRLRSEGGDWESDDARRLKIYEKGLQELAGVDVELSSNISREVAREAARLKKVALISFHDFEKTPPLKELCAIVEQEHALGDIAKVSTRIRRENDAEVLRALLRRRWQKPLCVIGMGREWSDTRIEFPKLGSCLTYGYLDKPTAPGQISAGELARRLTFST